MQYCKYIRKQYMIVKCSVGIWNEILTEHILYNQDSLKKCGKNCHQTYMQLIALHFQGGVRLSKPFC